MNSLIGFCVPYWYGLRANEIAQESDEHVERPCWSEPMLPRQA